MRQQLKLRDKEVKPPLRHKSLRSTITRRRRSYSPAQQAMYVFIMTISPLTVKLVCADQTELFRPLKPGALASSWTTEPQHLKPNLDHCGRCETVSSVRKDLLTAEDSVELDQRRDSAQSAPFEGTTLKVTLAVKVHSQDTGRQ